MKEKNYLSMLFIIWPAFEALISDIYTHNCSFFPLCFLILNYHYLIITLKKPGGRWLTLSWETPKLKRDKNPAPLSRHSEGVP
jgi:hypothetical protein